MSSAVVIACIAFSSFLDSRVSARVHELPASVVGVFDVITDYGKSGWLIGPLGMLLVTMAALPPLSQSARLVFAALAARVGFLFAVICASGLCTLVIKQLIGRTRPYAAAGDTFSFHPLAFQAQYMGFPSGHSTTAFAAAVAVTMVWPRTSLAALAWGYAFLIGLSRVIVGAHFPTDVLASAIVGVVGALWMRRYFVDRRLVFAKLQDDSVRAFPGPSLRHLHHAVKELFDRSKGGIA